MTKYFVSATILALMLLLGLPAIASAHVLQVDDHIGAVLHINPDDNPTTGNSTDYVMSFQDDTGKFSLAKCDCSVSFIENGNTDATKPLVDSSNQISENHYAFQKPAVYTLRFIGTPKTPDAFQPFRLDYEVRVTNGQLNAQAMPLTLWIGLGLGIALVLLAAFAMNYDNSELTKRINKNHQ